MLHGDHTGAGLCGQVSFGGKFTAIGAQPARDVFPDPEIELQIGGLFELGVNAVLRHGGSFFSCEFSYQLAVILLLSSRQVLHYEFIY